MHIFHARCLFENCRYSKHVGGGVFRWKKCWHCNNNNSNNNNNNNNNNNDKQQ